MKKRASAEAFFDATIRTVAEVGLENFRTKMIANYSGFSEGTMFTYFKNKDDMLIQSFLEVDRRVSSLLTESNYEKDTENMPFEKAAYMVWHNVYRYLIEHKNETLYLIRFRYCALYTDELRSRRKAYNGSFDKAYELVNSRFGIPTGTYQGFIINYTFELTLCFAEKILTGRVEDTEDMEKRLWATIIGALKSLMRSPEDLTLPDLSK